jgi:sialate O-acetylesterase
VGVLHCQRPGKEPNQDNQFAADLRRQFGEALTVLVFQLPEFDARSYEAGNSGWSARHDAQRRFVVEDLASSLVVVLGAGDPWDIHPPNKQEPARRAVPVWQAVNTAAPIRTGYSPDSITRKGNTLRITLPQTDRPCFIAGSDAPVGFSLCETDGTCRFATASLSRRVLELRNAPRRTILVRYCWGDTPVCNLMSPNVVPVTPFELAVP